MRYLTSAKYIDAVAKTGSIRKTAEALSITSTALNRRILAVEEELGAQIFERLPRGVRLSSAGEILVHHIRNQLSDMERVKSQISDLTGVRRGHISIACSQALAPYFLPEQISKYREVHNNVTFGIHVRDRDEAEKALTNHMVDIAIVFEPVRMAEFHTIISVMQPVHAVLAKDHPLASQETVRLSDCLNFPTALPTRPYGVRHLLEQAALSKSQNLKPIIESDSFDFLRHYAATEHLISFQIPIGLSAEKMADEIVSRPIDSRDVPAGVLYMGQLKGRTLPVASARFAAQLSSAFAAEYDVA